MIPDFNDVRATHLIAAMQPAVSGSESITFIMLLQKSFQQSLGALWRIAQLYPPQPQHLRLLGPGRQVDPQSGQLLGDG